MGEKSSWSASPADARLVTVGVANEGLCQYMDVQLVVKVHETVTCTICLCDISSSDKVHGAKLTATPAAERMPEWGYINQNEMKK